MCVERRTSAKPGRASLSRCPWDWEANAEKKVACKVWEESPGRQDRVLMP